MNSAIDFIAIIQGSNDSWARPSRAALWGDGVSAPLGQQGRRGFEDIRAVISGWLWIQLWVIQLGAFGEAMTSMSWQNSWNAPHCPGCGGVHLPDAVIAWCLSGGTVFCCLLTNIQTCSSAVTHQSWPRREYVLLHNVLFLNCL